MHKRSSRIPKPPHPFLQLLQKQRWYPKSFPCCLPSQGLLPAARVQKCLLVWRNVSDSPFPFLTGFPPPILELKESYPLAGTDINVTCSGHVLTSPSPTLQLQGAPDLPAPGEPAWLLLTAREEDDGRNFSCEASLEVQGQWLMKTTVMQLHVLCE